MRFIEFRQSGTSPLKYRLEIDPEEAEKVKDLLQKMTNKQVILVKFSAEWCKPCKKIKPLVEDKYKEMPENVIIVEIDIDESLDLYMVFKTKKMLTFKEENSETREQRR